MTDIELKLKRLQTCLGERKLKQIGLIPCSTCQEIMESALHLRLSPDLKEKPFLTPEEISSINASILESAHQRTENDSATTSPADLDTNFDDKNNIDENDLEHLSSTLRFDDDSPSSKPKPFIMDSLPREEELSNDPTQQESDSRTATLSVNSSGEFEISPELVASLNTTPIQTEQELVTKLLAILNQSHPPIQADLGMGYTYGMPSAHLPHSLCCSECGRLYTITHPDLKLTPLPVYLSDTEYEMLKGIYVDILL